MQVVHFLCTQFQNFWHITCLSIDKHRKIIKAQISLLNPSVTVNWQNFGGDEYLCKLGKEYLNASLCKFVVDSLHHSETFDVSDVFLPLTTAELSPLKQVRFFGPPCIVESIS